MKYSSLLVLIQLLINVHAALAENCHYQYWEVIPIPGNACEVYYLPDFTFSAVPHSPDSPEHVKRFCAAYEIVSKFGKQRTGYCYTGEGDRMGPTFKLGDEKWLRQDQTKENVYFADLNFTGCFQGKETSGVVFGVSGWNAAPKEIERSWPIERRIAKCRR